MRYTTLFFLLASFVLLALNGCDLTNSNSLSNRTGWELGPEIIAGPEEELTEEQQNSYRADAEKLAIRYVNNSDSTETSVPDKLVENLYNGLIHIATSGLQKAKEVTDKFQIHARVPSHPRQVVVHVDTTAKWTTAWKMKKHRPVMQR